MRSLLDPVRPSRKKQQARSPVLCSRQDDWCSTAELYLVSRGFNRVRGGRARSITLLNAHARSSGISSMLYNTTVMTSEKAKKYGN